MLLKTLGELSLEGSDFSRPKPLLLLAYLALEGPKPRRYLAELFFMDTKDPFNGLSQALKLLRKNVPGAVEADTQKAWTTLECDAGQLLDLAGKGRFEACIELYGGPFAEVLNLPLGLELEEWVLAQSEHLASTARSAYLSLAEAAFIAGNVATAREHAETALNLAGAPPLDEPDTRLLRHLLTRTASDLLLHLESEMDELGLALAQDVGSQVRLPTGTTSFVGRRAELAGITARLAQPECRLLTLIGPGGIGKTRLALEAAQWLAPRYADGVIFVELSSVGAAELVGPTLARALDLPLHGRESPTDQLLSHLQGKSLLLVLDNFEHLLDSTDLLVEILAKAPGTDLLVTSRERLDLHGEWLSDLEGLPYPLQDELDSETFDAVQLFVHSARRQNTGFQLETQGTQVGRICRLVQGMPLALELASSWARLLSCEVIADEIEKSLSFLSTTARDLPDRHRSLKAVFEGTWSLLSQEEQRSLSQISLFRGGFSREAATVVADTPLTTLLRLANKSLIKQTAAGRFAVHEAVRWFAFEKLSASPEEAAVQARFENYYAAFLRAQEERLRGPEQGQALDEIGDEVDNIRVAWARCAAAGKVVLLEDMIQSLYHFFVLRSRLLEGEQLFAQAVAALRPTFTETTDPDLQRVYAKIVSRQAHCNYFLDRYEVAGALLKESLVVFHELGEQREEAIGYSYLGHTAKNQGNFPTARGMYEKSLALFRALGNLRSIAVALNDLAEFLWLEGNADAAQELYEESLPAFEELGDRTGVAHIQRGLGRCSAARGDVEAARALYKQSLTTHQSLDNPNAVANTLHHIGLLHLQLGEYDDAAQHLVLSLQTFRAINERNGTALVLSALAEVALARGDYQSAETSYKEALTIATEIGNGRLEADIAAGLGDLQLITGDTRSAQKFFGESLNLSKRLKYTQGVAYARQRQGYLAYSRGHHEEARCRFEESCALYSDKNLRRGRALALAGFGRMIMTSEPSKAASYLRDALVTASEGRTDAITLSVLVEVAAFLSKQGRKEEALSCLALPLHHFAATRVTQNEAGRLATLLTAGLPTDVRVNVSGKDEGFRLLDAASEAIYLLDKPSLTL